MNDRELPLRRPLEGWAVVALVALLALTLGWALDDPAWVNGRSALTDLLGLCALLGAFAGFIGPKLGWGRWTTHLLGALFAGLLIPVIAGFSVAPGTTFAEAFRFAAVGSVDAYLDLAWRNQQLTDQEVHYTLTLGAIVWGTMQFAAYAVFGHRRPLSAVVIIGLVLLANMALTARDQLGYLMLFTATSLFLLIQMHTFDERSTWVRRRIGDPGQLSALYLRGGTVFIVIAMIGSVALTQRAASAPLAGAWDGVSDQLLDVGEEIARLFPAGGDWRGGGGVSFGSSARIAPRWFSDDAIAFIATVPTEAKGERWRAATYDTFDAWAWVQTGVTAVPVEAGQPLLGELPEAPNPDHTVAVEIVVRPEDFRDSLLLAPGTPTSVSRTANVLVVGEGGWFGGVDLPGGREAYTVQTSVFRPFEQEAITGNKLIAATEAYPDDIVARYTAVTPGSLGPDATDLLETIRAMSPSEDPYDLAVTMQDFLRSSRFVYTPDVTDVECDGASAVECFARTKRGYCLHYASTMAMLLRAANPEHPIPTRLVQGFLSGDRVGVTETVRNLNAHAWVEVYFPDYGWIPFDPTGGGRGQPSRIPPGPEVASAAPDPSSSSASGVGALPPNRLDPDEPGGNEGGGGPLVPRTGDQPLFIVLTIILALAVAGIAVAAWMRGPRGEVSPESAWHTLARTASRFGFGPRPTETVYEYAATLGELVPVAEDDLQTVAVARVETVYARTSLPGPRLQAVRDATRRLRVSMLRLAFRRRGRHRR